jgi:hypothetical protein
VARALITAFLVSAGVAFVIVLLAAMRAWLETPAGLLFAAPIVAALVAAWLLPGTWPDGARRPWSAAVGLLATVSAVCGLLVGGFVGVWTNFATGQWVIGY